MKKKKNKPEPPHREICLYVGDQGGGCSDVGAIVLNPYWTLIRVEDLIALRSKALEAEYVLFALQSISEEVT